MAEDFSLNESDNKPNPGPVPFSYQSIFDAFKNKDTKSLQVYDDKIKNLREVKTPDELGEVLANKESQINFFSQNRDKLQNFGIFNPEDFSKKASGQLTDFDKINIAETSGSLKSTPVPKMGEPGFGTFIKNQKHYQFKEQDAIDMFSQMAASGLNVKHTGEEIVDYNQMREYFSDPTNVENWQKQKSTQDKLFANKLNVPSILERLQPKETIPAAEMEVAQAVVRDKFFGKIDDSQIGKLLDEGGEIQFDEFSGLYQDIDEQDFLQRIGQETLSASGEDLGINEVSVVNKKEDTLNKQSLDRYLTSLGMNPEEIMSFKIDKIEKYRHQKFLNQDLQNNISSAEGIPVDIFQADQNQTSLSNRQATFYAFGSKNEYQQRMDIRGYNMLSEQDQKVHTKRLEIDKLRRELEWYKNGSFADYKSAEERIKKAEGDLQAALKETGQYSGFTIYDPETRQPFAQEVVSAISTQVNQKYNKEYYAKTALGKMKRERNALFLDTETLKNELSQSLNPESEDYQIKKRLYLQKSVELYTLNRALYTNDNPMKRLGNGLQQFLDGVKEAASPDANISRLDETLAMYNNLSKYGIVLEDKDIEEVQKNLDYTMMETLGSGTYETTKILLETIAYSYMGMGALNAATRLKQYTRLKEGMGALYGQRGTALVNHFEKLVEFGVKGGAQIAAGQTTAGYVTEEAAEGAVDYVANTFKKLYSNKVSAFLTKFVAGTVGSSIGEFFGNMSDALLENGFDVSEAFKETYGEDWETQEKQLAVLGLMSMGFAGASNIGLLIKTKESFAYWKQQLGGKFTDPLAVEVERIIDETIENYRPSTITQQRQVQNIQSENPETLPITDAVEMSSEPIEPPVGGVSEPTEPRVLEPVPTDKAAEVKQAEKLEVEKRVAERGEIFHVVEADGSVNKEVEYRYNETTGKIESRGYTAFNNSFEEVNDELARTIEAKVNDSGMLSKTKATEIASQTLGLDKAERLVEIDGQVYLSRDPKTIKEESDKKITNVNTVAKNTFSNKIKELRNKVKDVLFSDVETQFTPEFNDFYKKLKTSVGLRLNRTSLLFKDAAYLVESSYKGLPKVADYLGSISKSFSSTKAGLDLFTEFTNKILTSKRFQNSDLSKDANASDYAKNIALQMLLNEDPSIAEYFDNDKEAISSFNRFRVGFVRHAAKNFTAGTVKYNASFFNQNVNPKVEKRTEQDLDRTERDQLLVREQRRGIKKIFDMAGEGDRLDLSNDDNLKTVDAIRYSKGELSAEDFLNSIGESFEGMTPQEVSQLAEQKQNELVDINKFEAWSQKLADFAKTERQVKKKLRKELNKTFNYISPESSLEEGVGVFNRAYVGIKKAVESKVNIGKRKRQKNRQVADVMYEMLQTMALRSNSTPEQMLEEQINFQKASQEQAREIIQKAYDSGELNVLFDFYAGGAGASYSKEIYSNLKKAEELLTNGVDPKRVLLMYGALYGPDGSMRIKLAPQFKFKDTEALNKIYKAQSIGRVVELSSLVDFPELFELYPDLKKLKVEFAKPDSNNEALFEKNPDYTNQANVVRMSQTADQNIFDIGVSPGKIILSPTLNANELIGVLKHEIQHGVQSLEGMEPGSNTEITKYFAFTKAQAKSFIDDYTLGRIAERQESEGFDGYLSESQRIYEQELLSLGELMTEVSELLSEMGGDVALGSRGSLFLFANLIRTGFSTKTMGEDILPVITEKVKTYLPLGNTTQEIEQNTKNIARLSEIVNDIITGPGSIKKMELARLIDSASSFALYQNNLGEMEARSVQETHFNFYNFHSTLEKTINNALKQNLPFNRKMAKYLSDRANMKRIELAEEIRQSGAEFISSMPSSDIELMKVVDEFLSSDAVFDLNENSDFQAFRFNVQRLTQELSDSYSDAVNFLKSEGVSVLSDADINFGNNITNALVEKILNSAEDKSQVFKGNQRVPSFVSGGAEDPSAIGEPSISNKAIDAQIRLEDELYAIEAPETSEPRNGDTLFQNESGTVRGAVVFDDTRATIYAMTDPTVATPLHELAHVYEKYLTTQERQEILNASGKDAWDRSVSEYFARGFEKYLADGVSPGTTLVTAFRKFKVWMSSIFNTFEQPDVELNEDMRRIYSIMLGETPLSDVPGAEISSEVSDTNQVKDELGNTIESMRKAGNTDQEIYQGLISEGLFSAADISEYFDLNTKQTVYDQVQNSGKFAEEARDILEDSQHVIRSLAELKKEMANISEEEARGILYSLNSLPDIDVSVAKLINAMLENQGKGIRSVEDFMLIAKTGTNVGRALQRFKMLKKQQPKLILASLVKDLNAVGAKIPTNALRILDEAASRLVDATENLEIAKQANQDARFINSTSPFDPNKSNHEYFNDAMIEFQKAKLDYSKKMQPWARVSVNKGAGKAFTEWYKTSVRLNLLTFRSLGRNVSSNLVKGALNTAVNKIATATSIIRSIIVGGGQTTFKGLGYNLATGKGVVPGLKQTGQVLRYGNVTDIGKKIEINGGFNGFRAAAEWIGAAFAKLSGASDIEIADRFNFVLGPDNKIKNGDKFLRFAEGSLGVFSETIGRLMQAGDLVFKNTAYYGAMHQEAKRRGLKGKEIKHFMDLHSDYSDANSFEDALTFVYANDSKAYKAVSRMFSGGGSDFYSSLWTTLVPYQKIPTNVFAEYFEFMTPLYGLASAGLKFNDASVLRKQLKKERNANKKAVIQEKMDRVNQKAEQSIGRAMTGFGLYMIAFELVKLGVLSAKSQSRKEREEKDQYGGDNRINLTLLLEQLGYIPKTTRDKQEWVDGDVTMELEFLGAMGAIFALSQAKFENLKKDVYNKPLEAESKKINEELEPNMNIVDIIDPTDLSNVFGPLGYNLNLSFVKNLGSATEAILDLSNADSEDPGKMAKFFVDLTMTSISSVLPNIMTDLTKLTEGEDGVKFDYNIKELNGGEKVVRDLGARLNERLFRVFTDNQWMDADTDRDVFNQAKKLTPTGRSPLAYQMFDLTRTNLEKGLSTRHNQFMNQAKKPSWQDLVAIARLYNAPESVFPGLPKPIKETSIGAIKLNPTLDEIREHKATVLKIREQVVNSVIDEMYNKGDLRTFFDMTEEINQKKQYQVPFGIRAFSKIMSSVYSKSESIVNKYSIPLIEVNYIGRLKQDNPKAYAKYQKMVSENIYGTFYEEIENNPEYKAELEEFKLKVLNDIKDVINNQTEVSLAPFE